MRRRIITFTDCDIYIKPITDAKKKKKLLWKKPKEIYTPPPPSQPLTDLKGFSLAVPRQNVFCR